MTWVRSPDYGNTLGAKRKRERDDLRHELEGNMGGVVGGLDALAKAQKAAGLEVERKEDRSKKQTDDLEAKKLDAEKLARELEDRTRRNTIADEDRARKLPLDDLERKLYEAKIGAITNPQESPRDRLLRETAAGKARAEEEASGESERRKKAKRVLEAAESAAIDPDDAAAMVEALRTEDAFSEDELNEIRTEITREQEDRRLTKEKREAEIGAIKRRGVPRAGPAGGSLRDEKAKADIGLVRARTAASQEAAKDRGLKREEADKKVLGELQAAEKSIWQMTEIEKESGKYNTGPFMDRAQDLAGTILPEAIYNPSERNAWKAKVARIYNAILKEQSGAAVTASEETRQLVAQLNTKMDDSTFDAVLRDIRTNYQRDVENARERLTPSARAQAAETQATDPQAAGVGDADIDAILDEHPDWTEEQIEAELERRQRGG